MKRLLALVLLVGCGPAPESFHRSGPDPVECADKGGDWFIYTCHGPSGEGKRCLDAQGNIKAKDCILHTDAEDIYCVEVCE